MTCRVHHWWQRNYLAVSISRKGTRSSQRHPARRRAVYTAIFGKYDRLHAIPEGAGGDDLDFICFTDDDTLSCPGWQMRQERPRYRHPRLAAKHFKTLPHVVLADYDETIWVDGSFCIEDQTFADQAFAYLDQAAMALFLHPDRGCIYEEAEASKAMAKYADQDIDGQVASYRNQGYPERGGLFACGIVARRRDDPAIRRLNELWIEENLRFTYQDQLSMAFLVWKLNIRPAIFHQYLWRCRWGSWHRHANDL